LIGDNDVDLIGKNMEVNEIKMICCDILYYIKMMII